MAYMSDDEYEKLVKSLNAKPVATGLPPKTQPKKIKYSWETKYDDLDLADIKMPKINDAYKKALSKALENILFGSMTQPPSDYYDMNSHSIKIPLTKKENPDNLKFEPESYMDPRVLTLK